MVTARDEGKGREDGEQLLTDRLKTLGQGVIYCDNIMPKSELGESLLDRLGKMMSAGGEGKGRGDGEQLLTSRLKKSDQGVIHCYNRMPKSELGVSQLDRLGTMVTASDEGKGKGESERVPEEYWRAGGQNGEAPWETIAGEVSAMLNAHYRTCKLTTKHEYVISHTHSRTCILTRKRYDYPYLRAAIASLRTGERSGRCSLGLLLHTGTTTMGNGCSLGLLLHTGATSMGNVSGAMSAGKVEECGDFAFFAEMSTLDISAESAKFFL